MKILLVNDFGAPYYGAEVNILGLRDGLRARGHEAVLFSSRSEHRVQQRDHISLEADVTCFGTTTRLQALTQLANPSAYIGLRRILREFSPDLVHVQIFLGQLSPLILPLLRDVPCLYQVVVYNDICPMGSKLLPDGTACTVGYGSACLRHGCVGPPRWATSMLQLALLRRWRSVFDLTVAQSVAMRQVLAAAGLEGIGVLHNGVTRREMRPALSGPPLVAYAGRLSPEKGVGVLLRAFAAARREVPAARLLIAGDGPEAASLRHLASSLDLDRSIEWLGHVRQEALEARFASAWVQAVPSLWQEPFGNVTAEAMMRGTAVLASRVGGAIELVDDGVTGLFATPGDVDGWTRMLVRLLHDPAEAERLGAAAHVVASETLGRDAILDKVIGLYDETIRRARLAR